MNVYEKLEARFQQQVKKLQETCKHKQISAWALLYNQYTGHFSENRKCLRCNKVIETRWPESNTTSTDINIILSSTGTSMIDSVLP